MVNVRVIVFLYGLERNNGTNCRFFFFFFFPLKVSSFLPYSNPFLLQLCLLLHSLIVFHLNFLPFIPLPKPPTPPSLHPSLPSLLHCIKASWTSKCQITNVLNRIARHFITVFNAHSLTFHCPLVEPCHRLKDCSITLSPRLKFIHRRTFPIFVSFTNQWEKKKEPTMLYAGFLYKSFQKIFCTASKTLPQRPKPNRVFGMFTYCYYILKSFAKVYLKPSGLAKKSLHS